MLSLADCMRIPCVEPKKRLVGGHYGWVIHRFPIKGGISRREMWMRDLYQPQWPSLFAKDAATMKVGQVIRWQVLPPVRMEVA